MRRELSSALTPTSYLVLGLLAREGPSTPYDLKRQVSATIGHFSASGICITKSGNSSISTS
jgi:DNA-binding PadR family transcriptional regulator